MLVVSTFSILKPSVRVKYRKIHVELDELHRNLPQRSTRELEIGKPQNVWTEHMRKTQIQK